MFVSGDHAYEVEVKITLSDKATEAGIVLMYDSTFNMGIGATTDRVKRIRKGSSSSGSIHSVGSTDTVWLRIRNDNHLITGYHSYDGKTWQRETWCMDCSGYTHNTLYQFQSVLPALYVCGSGSATFSELKYTKLDF